MTVDLDYHVVDVFTDRPYAGNPLAVVLDADGLSTSQLQSIAREFNLSETTFVLAPTTTDATYRARIFTPGAELPFAGHPTVGTAWLLSRIGRYGPGVVVQECGAGLLPVTVGADGAEVTGGTPTVSDAVEAGQFVSALGLGSDDLVGTPVRWCGCGLDWAFVHVRDDALQRVTLDLAALSAVHRGGGVCAFSFDAVTGAAHSRCFAAGLGVPEDPATGSAALGLAVFLVESQLLPRDGASSFLIRQGAEMGRPSQLTATVTATAGRAVEAKVSGQVASVATGRISPPPV